MVSGFRFCVLCVFYLLLVPAVWAEICMSYWDINDYFHDTEECYRYCCGDCNAKYCCNNKNERLEKQEDCPERPYNCSYVNIGLIVGTAVGVSVFILICVILICCIAPCCLIYKQCRKRSNQRQTIVTTTTVNTPQPPHSPSGPQPAYGGYQSVPVYEGPPIPTAPPPSYTECTAPDYSSPSYSQGQPMFPLHPPGQYNAPPQSDEFLQPPFNPSYGTQD